MLRLRELRKLHKLSQEDLAERYNVDRVTISRWENEQNDIPNKTLLDIANFFNISIDYLLGKELNNNANNNSTLDAATNKLMNIFSSLNGEGQAKILEYASDISSTKKYKANDKATEAM